MEETTEDNKTSADLTRREFIATSAQVIVAGAAVLAISELPACAREDNRSLTSEALAERVAWKNSRTVEEYVESYMGKTSVNQILNKTGISIGSLKILRSSGYLVGSDLTHKEYSDGIEGIAPDEWEIIRRWYDEQRNEYADNYYFFIDHKSYSQKEYVSLRMHEVSLDCIPHLFGVSLKTSELLQHANIETIVQWQSDGNLNIPTRDVAILNHWYD